MKNNPYPYSYTTLPLLGLIPWVLVAGIVLGSAAIVSACQDKSGPQPAYSTPDDIRMRFNVLCLDGVRWYVVGDSTIHKNEQIVPAVGRDGRPVPCDPAETVPAQKSTTGGAP